MPRSRNRYSRSAIRAKYRKPKRRRGGRGLWNVVVAVVVVVGSGAVFLTVRQHDSAASQAPLAPDQINNVPGDHWHTFLGANICGLWLPSAPAFEKAHDNPNGPNVGIHSHGDGLIHTHPFTPAEQGSRATVGKFLDYGGWSVGSDFMDLWSGPISKVTQTRWENGDRCPVGDYEHRKGILRWAVDGKEMTGNPADYNQKDGEIVVIAFLPKGVPIPLPPDACTALGNIGDLNGQSAVDAKSPCLQAPPNTTAPTTTP